MLQVSCVGHSQLPHNLSVPETEIKIFRAPGGRADNLFSDHRLNDVLDWEHDFCILWLGSNDIEVDTDPNELFEEIKEVYETIANDCGAVVHVCLIEPRFYPGASPIDSDGYRKIQNSVNKKIKRKLTTRTTHFTASNFVEALSGDGVHWNAEGKEMVRDKLESVIVTYRDSE